MGDSTNMTPGIRLGDSANRTGFLPWFSVGKRDLISGLITEVIEFFGV